MWVKLRADCKLGQESRSYTLYKKTILLVNTWFNKERTKVANLATYCLSPEARATALGWALFFLLLYVPVLRDIYGTIFEKSRKTGIIPFYGTINNYAYILCPCYREHSIICDYCETRIANT